MYVNCCVCEQDKGPVIEGLALDMADVLKNHVIPDEVDEKMYNGIQDVKAAGFLVNDVFDAIMLERQFSSFSKADLPDDDKVE